MSSRQDLWLRRHPAGELQERDYGSGKRDATDNDTKVGCDEMESGRVHDISHDTTDTGQDGSQTNHRVKSGDSLRKIGRSDSLSDEHTSDCTKCSKTTKLSEDFRGKASSEQTSQHTCTDTEDTESITHTRSGLGSKTGDGANAENRADEITGLNETSSTSGCSSYETATTNNSRNCIEPGVLRGVSRSYSC